MKKDYLTIYSAYLPYDLDVLTPIWNIDKDQKTIQKLHTVTQQDLIFKVDKDGFLNCWFEECKPILYSMDMLTKEIEHKGERFIPIKKLGWGYSDGELGEYINFGDSHSGVINVLDYLDSYNMLLEWHFNVFDLDESEFIKKETLTL